MVTLFTCLLFVAAAAVRPTSIRLHVSHRAAALTDPRRQLVMSSAPSALERAALLARARQRHLETERALRPPTQSPEAADTMQDSSAEVADGERPAAPAGPSSFGIPSSRFGWVAVFGPLTVYALLGFAGYGASVAAVGTAAVEAYKALAGT